MKAKPEPVAGIDYPRTYQEFERWFADEASCRNYLFRLRWPQGFNCPRCDYRTSPWVTKRGSKFWIRVWRWEEGVWASEDKIGGCNVNVGDLGATKDASLFENARQKRPKSAKKYKKLQIFTNSYTKSTSSDTFFRTPRAFGRAARESWTGEQVREETSGASGQGAARESRTVEQGNRGKKRRQNFTTKALRHKVVFNFKCWVLS